MADWFLLQPNDQALPAARRVLVTGAAGNIGSRFAAACHDRYTLTLMVHPEDDATSIEPYGEVVRGDITDKDQLLECMRDQDAVVHLAANRRADAPWETLWGPNIIGAQHAFAAAHEAGVSRFLFASSVNAVGAAQSPHQIQPGDPVTPGNLYGATKCFGEALARYYAQRQNMACFPLRIGAYETIEFFRQRTKHKPHGICVSPRDMNQLICLCLDTTSVRFAIVHALSRNDQPRMDISGVCELLGYAPQDHFTRDEQPAAESPKQ